MIITKPGKQRNPNNFIILLKIMIAILMKIFKHLFNKKKGETWGVLGGLAQNTPHLVLS
jgi:hypothetical protein